MDFSSTPLQDINTLNAGFPVLISDGTFIEQNDIGGTLSPYVYIVDSGNNRVNVFDWYGNFQFSFGSYGSGNGQFISPYDVTTDGNFVYVTDTGNNRVQLFDMSGNYVDQFGSFGTTTGFSSPMGIAVDENFLYVVDHGNNRVQVFQKVSPYALISSVSGSLFNGPTDCFIDELYFYVDVDGYNHWYKFVKPFPTNSLIASLPKIQFTATIVSRSLLLTGSLPKITMTATIHESQEFTLVATLPKIGMSATEINGLVYSMKSVLPRISMASTLDILFGMEMAGTLPLLTMQATLAEDVLYSLAASMPKIRFEAYLTQQVGSNFITIVLNTDNFAVTEYNNYNFDSIAELGGKYYAVGPSGLVRLDGSTDTGSKIHGTVRFAQIDLHKRVVSRIVDAYLSGKISGKVAVKIIQESQGDFLYTIEDVIGRLKAYRVKAPKNMRDRFASYEITNLDGSDISIEELSVISTAQPQRVR
jgi:hypothetical protein